MEISLSEKCKNLKEKHIKNLESAVNEMISLPKLIGIIQVGSSTYSKNYHDIDVITFFDSYLVPHKLSIIRDRYKQNKLWIEGVSVKEKSSEFNPGLRVFIKTFSNMKNKKILYGKDPYLNKKITLRKIDVAAYIWYNYHIPELYGQYYDAAFPNSIRAILSYADEYPEKKEELLKVFRKKFAELYRYLPKNAEKFLRGTNKKNFKELYLFFEESLKYFTRK